MKNKIGIVGLGLIGGSIFKGLENLGYCVVGVSKSQNGKSDNITDNYSVLSDCELVFVASAMNKVINDLREVEKYVSKDTVVCDVSSLKEFVAKETFNFNFIPTHPMAGTEFSGFENSFSELFKAAKWVVINKENKTPQILKKIITDLGSEIVFTDAKEHDEAVAMISHMPMVLAQALFNTVSDNKLAQKLASSGFRDMTRLALSTEEMACDMVKINSDNIEKAILKLYSSVGSLIKENYPEKIKEIKQKRNAMYKDGKNIL